jgi:hypothetical protein
MMGMQLGSRACCQAELPPLGGDLQQPPHVQHAACLIICAYLKQALLCLNESPSATRASCMLATPQFCAQ